MRSGSAWPGKGGRDPSPRSCGSLAVRQREPCGSPGMVGAVAGWTVTRPAAEGHSRADPPCSSGPPPYRGEGRRVSGRRRCHGGERRHGHLRFLRRHTSPVETNVGTGRGRARGRVEPAGVPLHRCAARRGRSLTPLVPRGVTRSGEQRPDQDHGRTSGADYGPTWDSNSPYRPATWSSARGEDFSPKSREASGGPVSEHDIRTSSPRR
jgi:hypothetical protein